MVIIEEYPEDVVLFTDDAYGVYIPKHFAKALDRDYIVDREKWDEDLDFLIKYPIEKDGYWETWQDVLDNMRIKIGRRTYFLYQDGSVWMVRDNEKTRRKFFKNID